MDANTAAKNHAKMRTIFLHMPRVDTTRARNGQSVEITKVTSKENTGQPGRTSLHQALRIDPGRLMSKLLHVLNV
jgi:hypothetical protein